MASKRSRSAGRPAWVGATDGELLATRFRDLGLRLAGTRLARRVERLHGELASRGLRFRPHAWLSTAWFSPDGVPGVAIPFFLAHPRLARLERKRFLEVEGGTEVEFMRLLRHECGHAIDTAYRLRRRAEWRRHFGRASEPYRRSYTPHPHSERFVTNLGRWYAQSHPTEDFAETFAVWLRPRSDWRARYAGRPALAKLEYVEDLMREIADEPALVRCREHTESIRTSRATLGSYYREKCARYGPQASEVVEGDLRRLFPDGSGSSRGEPAARFLRGARPELRRAIARWTGQYQYTVDVVLARMIERCEELDLRLHRPAPEALSDTAVCLTVQAMNRLHGRHHEVTR